MDALRLVLIALLIAGAGGLGWVAGQARPAGPAPAGASSADAEALTRQLREAEAKLGLARQQAAARAKAHATAVNKLRAELARRPPASASSSAVARSSAPASSKPAAGEPSDAQKIDALLTALEESERKLGVALEEIARLQTIIVELEREN